jgi:raw score 7.12
MYLDNTTQINSSNRGDMKVSFKKWLVSLNEVALNELGIDEMLTHLDDELNIINGNECEQAILNNLIQIFKDSEYH